MGQMFSPAQLHSLGMVEILHAHYAICINGMPVGFPKMSRKRKIREFSLPGGHALIDLKGMSHLVYSFQAIPLRRTEGDKIDVRIGVPEINVKKVCEWLRSPQALDMGLEDHVYREFYEESVEELQILSPEEFELLTFEKVSDFQTIKRRKTANLVRSGTYFKVSCPPQILQKFVASPLVRVGKQMEKKKTKKKAAPNLKQIKLSKLTAVTA